MRALSVKQKLVLSEIVSFAIGGLALVYYWQDASYFRVGVVLTAEYAVSIVNTWLWFQRTD